MWCARCLQSDSFKKLIEILEDTGLASDKKYGEIMTQLFQLFGKEWRLLYKTSTAMQKLLAKAKRTRTTILFFKSKIEQKTELSQRQYDAIISILDEWFKNESEVEDLANDWGNFHDEVQKFKPVFQPVADAIGRIVCHLCFVFFFSFFFCLFICLLVFFNCYLECYNAIKGKRKIESEM